MKCSVGTLDHHLSSAFSAQAISKELDVRAYTLLCYTADVFVDIDNNPLSGEYEVRSRQHEGT